MLRKLRALMCDKNRCSKCNGQGTTASVWVPLFCTGVGIGTIWIGLHDVRTLLRHFNSHDLQTTFFLVVAGLALIVWSWKSLLWMDCESCNGTGATLPPRPSAPVEAEDPDLRKLELGLFCRECGYDLDGLRPGSPCPSCELQVPELGIPWPKDQCIDSHLECGICGYDLRTLQVGARCPECGSIIVPAEVASRRRGLKTGVKALVLSSVFFVATVVPASILAGHMGTMWAISLSCSVHFSLAGLRLFRRQLCSTEPIPRIPVVGGRAAVVGMICLVIGAAGVIGLVVVAVKFFV